MSHAIIRLLHIAHFHDWSSLFLFVVIIFFFRWYYLLRHITYHYILPLLLHFIAIITISLLIIVIFSYFILLYAITYWYYTFFTLISASLITLFILALEFQPYYILISCHYWWHFIDYADQAASHDAALMPCHCHITRCHYCQPLYLLPDYAFAYHYAAAISYVDAISLAIDYQIFDVFAYDSLFIAIILLNIIIWYWLLCFRTITISRLHHIFTCQLSITAMPYHWPLPLSRFHYIILSPYYLMPHAIIVSRHTCPCRYSLLRHYCHYLLLPAYTPFSPHYWFSFSRPLIYADADFRQILRHWYYYFVIITLLRHYCHYYGRLFFRDTPLFSLHTLLLVISYAIIWLAIIAAMIIAVTLMRQLRHYWLLLLPYYYVLMLIPWWYYWLYADTLLYIATMSIMPLLFSRYVCWIFTPYWLIILLLIVSHHY